MKILVDECLPSYLKSLFPANRLPIVKEYEEKLRQALSEIKPGAFIELRTL